MKPLENIKAIVFDAYGTLLDVSSIDERLKYHFGDVSGQIAAVWRQKQLEYTWLRSLMNRYKNFYDLTGDALQFACKQFSVALAPTVLDDLMHHYYELKVYPDVAPALAKLQQKYKLAILSNANPGLLQKAVAHNKIEAHFSSIFSVDLIQKFKPDPAVYQIPVNGLDLDKASIVFLSSNTWDVAGAKSFGLKVVWVQRKPGALEELGVIPDGIAKDLLDFASQL